MARQKQIKERLIGDEYFAGDEWTLLCDADDEFYRGVGGRKVRQYRSFFVKIDSGDYAELWGFSGIVPHNWKTAYKIF